MSTACWRGAYSFYNRSGFTCNPRFCYTRANTLRMTHDDPGENLPKQRTRTITWDGVRTSMIIWTKLARKSTIQRLEETFNVDTEELRIKTQFAPFVTPMQYEPQSLILYKSISVTTITRTLTAQMNLRLHKGHNPI